jgi:hypothetical protein
MFERVERGAATGRSDRKNGKAWVCLKKGGEPKRNKKDAEAWECVMIRKRREARTGARSVEGLAIPSPRQGAGGKSKNEIYSAASGAFSAAGAGVASSSLGCSEAFDSDSCMSEVQRVRLSRRSCMMSVESL